MNDKSALQQIFPSYADCEYLNGEAVKDDDGTELQSVPWLCENRFDDFLDDIAYTLVQAGVSRVALMGVFLRHSLRVLNENPNSLCAGSDDNRNLGTDREISARFDRESTAAQADRAMCRKVSAYANLARHAVRCAGRRRRQSVA
jgi:hypothetical protein